MLWFILGVVIALNLVFTYTNGFQDSSSVSASSISSRSLGKVQAIAILIVFEFLGALLGGSAVANTINSITSWPDDPSILPVLASALIGACLWNVFTRVIKVPSSSTHALVGGILGAVCAGSGDTRFVVWGFPPNGMPTGVYKVLLSLFVSPILGFFAGYIVQKILLFALSRATWRINKILKRLHYVTIALLSFGHGANDTQKSMGVILLALSAVGLPKHSDIPVWVRLMAGAAMVIGVAAMVPGIIRKVGAIYRLRPVHSFASQLSSAATIISGSILGGPVAASQVIASSVMGVGTADRIKGVHWIVAKDMLMAWFLTIPCAGALSGAIYLLALRYVPLDK